MKKLLIFAATFFFIFIGARPALAAPFDPPPSAPFEGYCNGKSGIKTAIGCIPFGSTSALSGFFITWGIGIGGGITLLLLVYGGFLVMTSAGDPKRLQGGKELIFSAISGILLIIFSIFILRILGVKILGLF